MLQGNTREEEKAELMQGELQAQKPASSQEMPAEKEKIPDSEANADEKEDAAEQGLASGQGGEVKLERQINLSIKTIAISIIENHKQSGHPIELLNITFDNAELIMQSVISPRQENITQFRIQYMNIDNNYNHFLVNPVLFTPVSQKIYKKENSDKYFLNILINQNTFYKHINLFNKFYIEIDPFVIRVDQEFIKAIIDFFSGLAQIQSGIDI